MVWSGLIEIATTLASIAISGLRTARVSGVGNDVETAGPNRRYLVLVWFALLALGQMRSPFLPWGYGNAINLWLISLLLAMTGGSIARMVPLVLMWMLCFFVVPLPFGPPTVAFDLAYGLVVVVMIIIPLCLVLALRAPPAGAHSERE